VKTPEIAEPTMNDESDHRPWDPDAPGHRVLLECPATASPSMIARVVERHGYEVRTCDGPADQGGCDLIDHGACALVAGADVVVNMLDAADPDAHDVLAAVSDERRPPAVVVELTRPRLARRGLDDHDAVDRRIDVLHTPVTSQDLVSAIEQALLDRPPGASRRET
jgi:hypothetical protein